MYHFFGCQIFSSRIGRLYRANNSPRCSVFSFRELRGPKTHDPSAAATLLPLAKEIAQIAFLKSHSFYGEGFRGDAAPTHRGATVRSIGIVELMLGNRTRAWDLRPDFAFSPTDSKTFWWVVALTYRAHAGTEVLWT